MLHDKLNPDHLELIKEDKDDFKMSLISRAHLKNEFTIHSIEQQITSLRKMEKEAEGNLGLASGTVDNVERNNKTIKNMPSKKKHAIWMWFENNQIVKELTPQLKMIKESIKENEDHLDVIYKKFGFVESNVLDENDKKDNEARHSGDGE